MIWRAILDAIKGKPPQEADDVWDDRRKYNIEHGIPLTPEQQRQQDAIERSAPPLRRDSLRQ